jgi:hypothetical protein
MIMDNANHMPSQRPASRNGKTKSSNFLPLLQGLPGPEESTKRAGEAAVRGLAQTMPRVALAVNTANSQARESAWSLRRGNGRRLRPAGATLGRHRTDAGAGLAHHAQTLLRHANLQTTAIYIQVADGKRVEAIDRLAPFASRPRPVGAKRYGHLFPDDLGRIADAFDAAAGITADALRTVAPLKAVPSDQNRL